MRTHFPRVAREAPGRPRAGVMPRVGVWRTGALRGRGEASRGAGMPSQTRNPGAGVLDTGVACRVAMRFGKVAGAASTPTPHTLGGEGGMGVAPAANYSRVPGIRWSLRRHSSVVTGQGLTGIAPAHREDGPVRGPGGVSLRCAGRAVVWPPPRSFPRRC